MDERTSFQLRYKTTHDAPSLPRKVLRGGHPSTLFKSVSIPQKQSFQACLLGNPSSAYASDNSIPEFSVTACATRSLREPAEVYALFYGSTETKYFKQAIIDVYPFIYHLSCLESNYQRS